MNTYTIAARTEILAESADEALQVEKLAEVEWRGQALKGARPLVGKLSIFVSFPIYASEVALRLTNGHGVWYTVADLSPIF